MENSVERLYTVRTTVTTTVDVTVLAADPEQAAAAVTLDVVGTRLLDHLRHPAAFGLLALDCRTTAVEETPVPDSP